MTCTRQYSTLLELPDEVLLVIAEYLQVNVLSHVCSRFWENLKYKYLILNKIPYSHIPFYAFWQSSTTISPPGVHTFVYTKVRGPTVHELSQVLANSLTTVQTVCTLLTLRPTEESTFCTLLARLSALRVLRLHVTNCLTCHSEFACALQKLSNLEELVLDIDRNDQRCLTRLPTCLRSLSVYLAVVCDVSWLAPLDNLRTLSLRACSMSPLSRGDFANALQTKNELHSLRIEAAAVGFTPMNSQAVDDLVFAISRLPKCREVSLGLAKQCFDEGSSGAKEKLVQLRNKCPQVKKFSFGAPSGLPFPIFLPWQADRTLDLFLFSFEQQ
eukprot:TRINITY_DN27390_c0_g1_i1.p1 TRINITY_DN27390_c0_g1~~TRINITY_DN27390_c0_g1_i1.p1  ORF type:complete len:328 (-),score=2.17 TRINITY_DN27390_c0_g1_i1:28-1011(-)